METKLASEIKKRLQTRWMGSKILVLDSIHSTNDFLKQYKSRTNGMVIIAESQTAGKGRLGRTWHSIKGLGIYFSTLLLPTLPPKIIASASLMSGLAAYYSLEPYCAPGALTLKWPNDLLIDGKKVAGILCEYQGVESGPGELIVGIGINVNQNTEDFPPSIHPTATSLRIHSGKPVDRTEVICSLIHHLEKEYLTWIKQDLSQLVRQWMEHSNFFGKKITLVEAGNVYQGTTSHLNEEGKLVLVTKDGETFLFDSGEVVHSG